MTQQLLVKSKTAGYILTKPGASYTLTTITDTDYPAATTRGSAYLSGRFFVMTPVGEIYQSALDDGLTWDALEFIQSQSEGDRGVYLAKVGNSLVALRESSTEFFYDAGNPDGSILAPVQNATFQIGCAHENSVKEMAGTVVWMGHTREGFGRGIYTLEGQTPSKLSTPSIEKVLNADPLTTVYSWAANVGSHLLYGITLAASEVTLVYDFSTKVWSIFTGIAASGAAKTVTAISAEGVATIVGHGYADGTVIHITNTTSAFDGWYVVTGGTADTIQLPVTGTAFSGSGSAQAYAESYFPISSSTRCGGRQFMQHATSGILYEFSQSAYTDAGNAVVAKIRTPKLDVGVAAPKFMAQVEVIGDKVASPIALRYTDDDFVTYSPYRTVQLNAERARLRRLGKYSRRAFELIHVNNTALQLEALEVDE